MGPIPEWPIQISYGLSLRKFYNFGALAILPQCRICRAFKKNVICTYVPVWA